MAIDHLTIAALAEMMKAMPRLPRYELHCCLHVFSWVRMLGEPIGQEFPYLGTAGCSGIEIFAEPDFENGKRELREDGEIIMEGNLWSYRVHSEGCREWTD